MPLRFCLLCVIFVVVCAAPAATDTRVIRASGDSDYPPYEFNDENGTPSGFNVDIMNAVAGVMGLTVDIRLGPWNTVRPSLEQGEIDMLLGMYYSRERDRLVDFSQPYLTVYHSMFVRKDSKIRDIGDLKDKTVIVEEGDIMDDYVRRNDLAGDIVTAESQAEALRLLASGKYDCFLGSKLHGLSLIGEYRLDNIEAVGDPFSPREYCFAVREGDTELRETLNEGLAIIAQTGVYDKIYRKWFGVTEPHILPVGTILKYIALALFPVIGVLVILVFWSRSLKRQVARHTEQLRHELAERQKTEEALRISEDKYRTLFETSRDALGFARPDGSIVEVNQAWLDLFGYTREEVVGRDVKVIYMNPEDREKFKRDLESQGYVFNYEVDMRTKDGRNLTCLVTANIRRNPDGSVLYYQTNTHDITKRRQLEQQFIQAQKMESVGRLAGGIAHDFNNLLTVIIGNTDLLIHNLDPGDPLYKDITDILATAERAADLVRQLLAFSRSHIAEKKVINLNRVIIDMNRLLKRLIGENITFTVTPGENLPDVEADISQMEQVVSNLVVNARDALPEGGSISIETAEVIISGNRPGEPVDLPPGAYVALGVTDTGTGIPPEDVTRIFEPFYTTKQEGRGTGLGLSTCYGIAKQHNGTIALDTAVGHGSTFTVYIPVCRGKKEVVTEEVPSTKTLTGSECIIITEDEEAVRAMIVYFMKLHGYDVIEAANGKDALDIIEGDGDIDPRLLVTDVVMPHMTGIELSTRIKDLRPGIKIMFMSGYTDDYIDSSISTVGRNFIHKPFKVTDFLVMVRKILDSDDE